MPRRVGFALLLLSRVAAADDDHDYTVVDDSLEYVTAADTRDVALTTALASQATGDAASAEAASIATMRAEASVAEIVGTRAAYRFWLGGEAELRAGVGDVPELAGSWALRGGMEDTPLFDGGPHFGFWIADLEARRDYDALPLLRDPRELLRAPYDRSRYDLHFTFMRSREEGSNWSNSLFVLRFGWERTRQHNGEIEYMREDVDVDLGVYRFCHGPDSDLLCVHLFDLGGLFPVHGLTASHFYPVGVDGAPLGEHVRLDASVGVLFGRYDLPSNGFGLPQQNDNPDAGCDTLGTCILLRTVGYEVVVRDLAVPHRLEVTRRAYTAIGGELAIEDRAALATSWQLRRTTLAASAYAAHTNWWTIVNDRFSHQHRGITGGVDVGASHALGKRWRVDGALSAGRSWYGALDGAAPRAGLAAQGTLSITHELRSHWASLQQLRPATPPKSSLGGVGVY